MGACYRERSVLATNVKDAWNILISIENKEYGTYDSYNGSFNRCDLGKCLKKFDKCNDKTEKEVRDFLEDEDTDRYLSKWRADYIDCGVTEYFREKLVKETNKVPAPKFENIFVLYWTDSSGESHSKEFKEKPNDEFVLNLFNLNCSNISLYKEKKAITDNKVIDYNRNVKVFKSKPKDNFKEMHKYIFVGYCPE